MLVTKDFVFLHIPKTGGTFVEKVLRDHLQIIEHEAPRHMPYRDLPDQWRHLPAFCFVRNPWDWYVSWFHFQTALGAGRESKRVIWEDVLRFGQADFREAVTKACNADFEHRLAAMAREENIDLYSAYVRNIVGDQIDDANFTVLRFEKLRKQLMQYVRTHTDAPLDLKPAILQEPPRRTSSHDHYSSYYDADLRRLVGQKARWLCDRFGYRFSRGATKSTTTSAQPDSSDESGTVAVADGDPAHAPEPTRVRERVRSPRKDLSGRDADPRPSETDRKLSRNGEDDSRTEKDSIDALDAQTRAIRKLGQAARTAEERFASLEERLAVLEQRVSTLAPEKQ